MSILKNASKGIVEKKSSSLIYGPNGVGKTQFASQFPSPFFADIEKGSSAFNVTRETDIPTLAKYKQIITELRNEKHDFKTFVTDSFEALELLILDAVLAEAKVNSINKVGKFGEGHNRCREMMREIIEMTNDLTESRGIEVLTLGHALQKEFNDPVTASSYSRYTMRTNDKTASLVRDLYDNVYFLSYKVFTDTNKDMKTVAHSNDDVRVLKTTWSAAYDAKNRLNLPNEIVIGKNSGYIDYLNAVNTAKVTGKSEAQLREEITNLIPKMNDEKTRAVAVQKLSEAKTVEQLTSVLKRVTEATKQPTA